MKMFFVLCGLVLSLNLFAAEPRLVVNLLDYISADYAGAVSDQGKVLSPTEYQEQKEFAQTVIDNAKQLPEVKDDKVILAKVEELKKQIFAKAKPSKIADIAQSAKKDVIAATKISLAPNTWPSIENGKKLFAANCTSCHGANGYGDGEAGKNLDPKPANFHDEAMAQNPPFREFNVIRVGVPGTGMSDWDQLSDKEIWDLAYYVISLRHQDKKTTGVQKFSEEYLQKSATMSDVALLETLKGTAEEKQASLTALRLYQGDKDAAVAGKLFDRARTLLAEANTQYQAGNSGEAKTSALRAYLEGVEPSEPKLKALDPLLLIEVEDAMSKVRVSIESKLALNEVESAINSASVVLNKADSKLAAETNSPTVTFFITSGILLREGFEAVLIIIALLSVLKATNARKAAAWVHAGWMLALMSGVISWIFSGWVMNISGASREMMEGSISLLAVVVLLYIGFWLHSQTEITRWTQFINQKVKGMLEEKNHFGLLAISFMAVFREAFETVLFLRAIWLESGEGAKAALGVGVFTSLALVIFCAWLILKFSAKLPLKKIFTWCSITMIALAVILAGKGCHAFQETGSISLTALGNFRVDTLGIYGTKETLLAQIVVFCLATGLWIYGKRPQKLTAQA